MRGEDKTIHTKIDELAQLVAQGFAKTQSEIDDLAQMTARGFTEVHEEFKDVRGELSSLRDEAKADMKFLRGDIDIMPDRHVGTFRKDYDELAARVKKLEQQILTHHI